MATAKSKEKYTECVGKRKTSIARVRLIPASKSSITINDKDVAAYFRNDEGRTALEKPLSVGKLVGKYHISVKVVGGGIHSQAEAVRHGIARALSTLDPENRIPLKKEGLLTRDARIKERRKFGLKKARKSPQWSKR
ncbi:MAG: 30S ribosomal protein S9 [Patescibacteria group bacterium]